MSDPNVLRVLSYNVRSLRDDLDAVAAVVRSADPDVVLVQEAPRFLRWRSKRAKLARLCGLVVATADRPAGLLVMTTVRVQVKRTGFALLTKSSRLHRRAVCMAVVSAAGVEWTVASAHMSGDDAERRRHLPEIWAALSGYDAPLVLGADVNETPDGPVWHELATRLQDAFAVSGAGAGDTNPARAPGRRIDGVFADRRVEVLESRALGGPDAGRASDHLAVLAVLRQVRR
jgi:endonuclease/exonuclease/phosphatase family metal-dependent hydrolase